MASTEKWKVFLGLFIFWSAYIVIGIFVFSAVEGDVERPKSAKIEEQKISRLRAATMEKHNMTAAEFDDLAKKIRETQWEDHYEPQEWNYADSFWFVVVLLTTIGKPGE